jgi:glutamine amidotransferase
MTVLVVDYGMGNLASIARALEQCGARVAVSDRPEAIAEAERVVVPGVGAFADAMANLRARGWVEALRRAAREIPLLGICLGMQLLAESGTEGGEVKGLGLVPGRVVRLQPSASGERIPHIGWNEVTPAADSRFFADIPPRTDFYFVHSYHFVTTNREDVVASTPYCGEFVSVVARGLVVGSQFHPEKSSRAGRRFLRNFLAYRPC